MTPPLVPRAWYASLKAPTFPGNVLRCVTTYSATAAGATGRDKRSVGEGLTMTLPSSSPVPFVPPSGTFTVDSVTNLTGAALANNIDIDQGFKVNGHVDLPNWLIGNGNVCIYADELGGPTNKQLGCTAVPISPNPTDPPGTTTYNWTVSFPGSPPVLPDPDPGDSQFYRLAAVFTYGSQLTDIQAGVEMGMFMID